MKAIIFDLFGTLVYLARPTNPYLELFASVSPGIVARQLCLTRNLSLPRLAELVSSPLPAGRLDELEQMAQQEAASATLFDDTTSTLSVVAAARLKVLVSSNLAPPYGCARGLLGELVDYWNFSYDTGFAKPDRRMFTVPAEAYGIHPAECLVIGDSLRSDAAGAAAAGMQFVHLDRQGRHAGACRTLGEAVHTALNRVGRNSGA